MAAQVAALLLAFWAVAGLIEGPRAERWQHPNPRTLTRYPGP